MTGLYFVHPPAPQTPLAYASLPPPRSKVLPPRRAAFPCFLIVRHINNIYKVDELDRDSTCAKIAQVQTEGKRMVRRTIPYFNLDMIISVGYRVNSKRGVKFRQWANRVLKEYLVKGYAVNERIRHEQIGELRQLVDL